MPLGATSLGRAGVILGDLPWAPNAGDPPLQVKPGRWLFFTVAGARTVEAIADRIIPPDPQTPDGRDAYFTKGEYTPDPRKSPEWNRGAYLVIR